jgi:hypothetical protein
MRVSLILGLEIMYLKYGITPGKKRIKPLPGDFTLKSSWDT